jgi:hypothetical protein
MTGVDAALVQNESLWHVMLKDAVNICHEQYVRQRQRSPMYIR